MQRDTRWREGERDDGLALARMMAARASREGRERQGPARNSSLLSFGDDGEEEEGEEEEG